VLLFSEVLFSDLYLLALGPAF